MTPREIKLARRLAVDYMLIGMVLGGSSKFIKGKLQPNEMLSSVGRKLMEAAMTGNREGFTQTMILRHSFKLGEKERVADGLIRFIKESNVDECAYAVCEMMAEQLQEFTDIDGAIETLDRCVSALRQAQEQKETIA